MFAAGNFKKVKKAIIVDDSVMDSKLLENLLLTRQVAKDVQLFGCPVKALSYLSDHEIQEKGLIFLDLNMPYLDGFQFLEKFNRLDFQNIKL